MDDDRPAGGVGNADLDQGAVAGGADEHGEAVVYVSHADWVAEGVAHVVIGDAVLAGVWRDVWHTQPSYLAARMTASYLAEHGLSPEASQRVQSIPAWA
jgi:hypothetical protein